MLAQALSPRGTGTTRRLGGLGASGTDTTGRVGTYPAAWAASVRGRGRVGGRPRPPAPGTQVVSPAVLLLAGSVAGGPRARTYGGPEAEGLALAGWLALLLRWPCART